MTMMGEIDRVTATEAECVALLADVDAFLRKHDIEESQFSWMAVGWRQFVFKLRRGTRPREDTVKRVRDFMTADRSVRRTRFSRYAKAYSRAKKINMAIEAADKVFRATDPVEQAKAAIRRRGFHCFEAEIVRPGEIGKFMIGSRLVTKDELLAFAERHGWRREG